MSVQCIPPLHSKIGVYRGKPIFLFLLQNTYCGYSFKSTRRGGSNVHHQILIKSIKSIKNFEMKILNFTGQKNSVYYMDVCLHVYMQVMMLMAE